jgi:hypothetical protein
MPENIEKKEDNQGGHIDDIFSDTEKENLEDISQQSDNNQENISAPAPTQNVSQPLPEAKARILPRIFALFGVIVIIAALSVGGYWAYNKYGKNLLSGKTGNKSNAENTENSTNTPVVETQKPSPSETETSTNTPTINQQPTIIDQDQDGLTDEEELKLGTDPTNIDSDQDGLFDREEVKVYKTNPLNPDTDGDGHKDGAEVHSGFNPNGSGKLYEIKK